MKILRRNKASSLVATLLVLVVLSTIVIAFMQSMAVERMTARSAKNLLQAELAAESGVNAARSQALDLFSRYPDSATVWQQMPSGGITNEGTVFYFRASPGSISPSSLPPATKASQFNPTPGNATVVQTYAWPLISGANPVVATNLSGVFPTALNTTNSTDLNFKNWIGTAPGQTKKILRAQWVYLTNSSGVTNARYAYWIDDESFKVNLSIATNAIRGSSSLGTNSSEIPLQGVLSLASGISTNDSSATALVNLRNSLGQENLLSFRTASQAFSPSGTNAVADQLKFVATANSSALNLSRDGWKRLNINQIFFNGTNLVQPQISRFVTAVTNASPLFGQRFLRSSYTALALNATNTVDATNAAIYVRKLAANLRDFIDLDNQPTLLDASFSVVPEAIPTEAIEPSGGGTEGPSPIIAFGKENVPMLHEYAIQGRILSMNPRGWSGSNPGGAAFDVTVDHYFEFWNMGTTDISAADLGPNAFLMIYNQMEALNVNPAIPEGRPIKIMLADIPNLVFPAGQATVITTDPAPNPELVPSGSNIFIAPVDADARRFTGITSDSYSNPVYNAANAKIFNNSFRVRFIPRSNSYNDYLTCMFLGNDKGLLESFCALPVVRSSTYAMDLVADREAKINSNLYFTRGGSLLGNSSASSPTVIASSGDPRTLNEQLYLTTFKTGAPSDEVSRFFWSNLDDNVVPASSSFGALNTNFVRPQYWPDYTLNSSDSASAPSWIANSPMATIGELGHIFDPARLSSTSGNGAAIFRGGGRTLRVGQPESFNATTNSAGLWDGRRDSASRTWTAWRLTDIFDTTDRNSLPGAININGARRDGGVALKAALKGFTFQADTPGVGSITPSDTQINNLTSALTNRLAQSFNATNSPIFWERGELSELSLFQNGTGLTGVNMANVIDRGREELVRRTMNMVTTKGNVLSAYVVGQAISVDNSGRIKVLSTTRLKQTFELNPDGMNGQIDAFDPAVASQVTARFSPLTNFHAKSIWTSSE
jgi:Tfp pilus assembly protein PilX